MSASDSDIFFWKSAEQNKRYGSQSRNLGYRVHFGSPRLTTGTATATTVAIRTMAVDDVTVEAEI